MQVVMYRTSPQSQTYWFPFEGSDAEARAEFERINTLTPQQAPWLTAPARRGFELVRVEPL